MARGLIEKNYINFVRGFITESNEINTPEGFATDVLNVDILADGSIQRRKGLTSEGFGGVGYLTDGVTNSNISSIHEWRNANNQPGLNYVVVREDDLLRFYDVTSGDAKGNFVHNIDISSAYVDPAMGRQTPISTAYGNGLLYVVGEYLNPIVVRNVVSGSSDSQIISVHIRDLEGITEPATNLTARLSTITDDHRYNLYNQGWPSASRNYITNVEGTASANGNVVDGTRSIINSYPNNSDVYYYGFSSIAQSPALIGNYSPWELIKGFTGNTPAPKGHYILNAFERRRDIASGVDNVYVESRDVDTTRPDTVAFYASRLWLGFKNKLYYSQLLDDDTSVIRCYQSADPTAEIINSVVATDGGVLDISESGTINRLVTLGSSLLVFSDTGVWAVTGSSGDSFSGTSQSVNRISFDGCIGSGTVVSGADNVTYWTTSGINVITTDRVSGLPSAQSITDTTIKTFITDINMDSRRAVKGVYDELNNKVMWLYSRSESTTVYDSVLILDVTLGSFYRYEHKNTDTDTYIHDVVYVSDRVKVLVGNTTDDGYRLYLGEYIGTGFHDRIFITGAGVEYYDSHVLTAHDLVDDLSRNKQAFYLRAYVRRTEDGYGQPFEGNVPVQFNNPSGLNVQARWDFTGTSNSGKWSNNQQLYKYNRNYIPSGHDDPLDYSSDVLTSRVRIRGRGRSVQFYFSSEQGKDFKLLGFYVPFTASTTPR